MNSEEGVSLAKMAVTVLLVVLVIGAVVAIVYAAYSWFSSGQDKLGDQVTSIDKSNFSQYDDAQVSGNDVLSCLKTYRDSDIAIFVTNNALHGTKSITAGDDLEVYNYCALVTGGADVAAEHAYKVSLTTNADGNYQCADFDYEDDDVTIKRNTNFSPTTTTKYTNAFVKKSGKWYSKLVYSEATNDLVGVVFAQLK